MKLKDIMKYMVGDCTISVEDATNEEYNHVEDFMSDNIDKVKTYENAKVTGIFPFSNSCVQINVCVDF